MVLSADDSSSEFVITTVPVGAWMLPVVVGISFGLLLILPLLVSARRDLLVMLFPSLAWDVDPKKKKKPYDDYYWDTLPQPAKDAAVDLGYNQKLWDNDNGEEPASSTLKWEELTEEQQKSAKFLGYGREEWEEDDSSSSCSISRSSSSSLDNSKEEDQADTNQEDDHADTNKEDDQVDNNKDDKEGSIISSLAGDTLEKPIPKVRTASTEREDDDGSSINTREDDLSSLAHAVIKQLNLSMDEDDYKNEEEDDIEMNPIPRVNQSLMAGDFPASSSPLPQSLRPTLDTAPNHPSNTTTDNLDDSPEDEPYEFCPVHHQNECGPEDGDSLASVTAAAIDSLFTAGMEALFAAGPRFNNKYAQTRRNMRQNNINLTTSPSSTSSSTFGNNNNSHDPAFEGLVDVDLDEDEAPRRNGPPLIPPSGLVLDSLLTIPTSSTFSPDHNNEGKDDNNNNNSKTDEEARNNNADSTEAADNDDMENFKDDGCCQTFFWCRPRMLNRVIRKVVKVGKYDSESKELFRMGLPFLLISIIYGAADIGEVSVIGLRLGTTELSVFVVMDTILGITDAFLGGPTGSLVTVCSQAIGAKKYSRAGSYIQIGTILYVLLSIPHIILWWFLTAPAVEWFGFDEEVGRLAEQYTRITLFSDVIGTCAGALHKIYYLHGYVITSSVIETVEVVLWMVVLVAWVFLADTDLVHIAYMEMAFNVASLIFNIVFLHTSGWFDDYLPGLFGSFAMRDTGAVKVVLKTAIPMTLGHVLTYGEWEVLILLAGFLGPAEVTAWGILGTVWSTLEMITNAIGDASEIRCAQWLGAGKPSAARLSVYKSLLYCMIVGFAASAGILASYKHLPTWLTSDKVLQKLIQDSIPLVALGNVTLTFGSLAWTMVGSQGRYRLSTVNVLLGSWFVTVPLAAVFAVKFNFALESQVAAVVLGYMVSGTLNSASLFRSDWKKISKDVIAESHQ